HAKVAVQHVASGDYAATDPSAEREQHQVVHITAGAHPLLAESGRIGVVLEDHACLQAVLDFVANREVLETGEVVGGGDYAFFEQDKPWHADADAGQRIARTVSPDLVDYRGHVAQHDLATLLRVSLLRDFVEHFAAAVDGGGAQVGAAQVQSDGVLSHER